MVICRAYSSGRSGHGTRPHDLLQLRRAGDSDASWFLDLVQPEIGGGKSGRVQPLGSLTNLKTLRIPFNLFTTVQLAWLRAHLPENVESEALAPVLPLTSPFQDGGKASDVLLIGKRKPFLNSELDSARIRKHELSFEQMVSSFRRDPSLEPSL